MSSAGQRRGVRADSVAAAKRESVCLCVSEGERETPRSGDGLSKTGMVKAVAESQCPEEDRDRSLERMVCEA